MPDFEHPDIQEVSEKIDTSENLDQTIDVLYDLLLKLDEEYDELSSDIETESNKMILELNAVMSVLTSDIIIPYLQLDAWISDYFLEATALRHMFFDFLVDWNIDEDLMNSMPEMKESRRTRIEEIRNLKPTFKVYPNPVTDVLNVTVDFPYKILKDRSGISFQVVEIGGGSDIWEFDIYSHLPEINNEWFDNSTNASASSANMRVWIFDLQGNKILDASPTVDSHWNVWIQEDVSNLPSGWYVIRMEIPWMDTIGPSYTEISDDITNWVYTSQFIKI